MPSGKKSFIISFKEGDTGVTRISWEEGRGTSFLPPPRTGRNVTGRRSGKKRTLSRRVKRRGIAKRRLKKGTPLILNREGGRLDHQENHQGGVSEPSRGQEKEKIDPAMSFKKRREDFLSKEPGWVQRGEKIKLDILR